MLNCKFNFVPSSITNAAQRYRNIPPSRGSLPCNVQVHINQSYASEDLALSELIHSTEFDKKSIVVFDRGLQSRKAFDKFSIDKKMFIGRCNPIARIYSSKPNKEVEKPDNSTVIINSDEIGILSGKKNKTKNKFRIIRGVICQTNEPIAFITNIFDESPYVIAQLYRNRWEIEVFFKFLKQQLNCNHLISRNLNGIKVMIYMTMILACLIITHKKLNKISGYKLSKLKFEIELENAIIQEIVIMCGGDPSKAQMLWNSS
jgi:hypothetical protein